MKSRQLIPLCMGFFLFGCYHSVSPSVGYTFKHGFTYGVAYSGGYGYVGTNLGIIQRPKQDGESSENVRYITAVASAFGFAELGAGVGYVGDSDSQFAAIIDAPIMKPANILGDGIDFFLSPIVGVRYLGEAFEIYLSPRVHFGGTGGLN